MEDWRKELEDMDAPHQPDDARPQAQGKNPAATAQAWFERVDKFLDKIVAHPFKELAAELEKRDKHVSVSSGRWSRTMHIDFGNEMEMTYVIAVRPNPNDDSIWQEFKLRDSSGEVLKGGVGLPVMKEHIEATMSNVTKTDIIKAFMECYRAAKAPLSG